MNAGPMNTAATKEKRSHGTAQIPYSYFFCVIPDYFPGVPLHWHNEFEINYILEGQGYLKYEEQTLKIREGDVLIIQPNMLHAFLPAPDSRMVYETIVFRQQMLVGGFDDRSYTELLQPIFSGSRTASVPITAACGSYDGIREKIKKIFACARENTAAADLCLRAELLGLFYLVCTDPAVCKDAGTRRAFSRRMRPALEYVQEHYTERITVEDLARMSHMSKSYFMNQFRSDFGIAAIEYLNQVRIKAACDLLMTTDLGIADVAYEAGFRNLSNFNRQFRQKVGCPPRDYRKTALPPP